MKQHSAPPISKRENIMFDLHLPFRFVQHILGKTAALEQKAAAGEEKEDPGQEISDFEYKMQSILVHFGSKCML